MARVTTLFIAADGKRGEEALHKPTKICFFGT